MNSGVEIYAIHGGVVTLIPLSGLTPLGGRKSSGRALDGLKNDADYAILAPRGEGIDVHRLLGGKPQMDRLEVGQALRIEDLSLVAWSKNPEAVEEAPEFSSLQSILGQIGEAQNTEKPLRAILSDVLRIAKHEKGLIIAKGAAEQYEILVSENIDATDSWVSESVIQAALKKNEPVFVHNLIGSPYHSSQSLVATGFLSVFCWPLVIQGTAIGVLLTGSRLPHAGLDANKAPRLNTFIQLAALVGSLRLRELQLRREIESLRARRVESPFQTQNARLQSTCEVALQVADSDLGVLIQGETGTGKEVMARWIHERGGRKNAPFVAVNCGAIPSELMESLLFGHKKGAFTNAFQDQSGKLQQAHGGTLFLDEIGDLPPALQVKLLRVLNDKMVEPLGSQHAVRVDVRLIAATHKPLKDLLERQLFREDLYYRLAEMTLWIPPLRDRIADVLLIAQQWLQEMGVQKSLGEDARQWLLAQPWKGNARELKSVLKRAVVLCAGGEIRKHHFIYGTDTAPGAPVSAEKAWLGAETLEEAKQDFVQRKIRQALEMTAGNRTRAAHMLGVTPRTLFRYLEEDTMKDLS